MYPRILSKQSLMCATALSIAISIISSPVIGQTVSKSEDRAPEAAPTPVFINGNPTCTTVNASAAPALAHVTENWGLKLDFQPAEGPSGPFAYQNGGSLVLQGGAPAEPANSVSVSRTGAFLAWSSTRPVTAVIVKGASEANVYPYAPGSYGGGTSASGLQTPTGTNFIGHLIFCYENFVAPTAAAVSVAGRVIDLNGRGLGGVSVSAANQLTGEVTFATTSSFGYYKLDGLTIDVLYTIRVSSKRYQFFNAERTFVLEDNLQGFDFVRSQ